MDRLGVVAALTGDDGVHLAQGVERFGVEQRRGALADVRAGLAGLGGGEEDRLRDAREVVLGAHSLHQDRAHHAAPTDETNPLHLLMPRQNF
jgi:hypothetical protein